MKKITRNLLALVLALTLCLSLAPAALAAGNAEGIITAANGQNNFDYTYGSVEIVDAGANGAAFTKTFTRPANAKTGPVYAAVLPVDANGNGLFGAETRYVRLDNNNTLTYFRDGCRYFAVLLVQPLPDAGDGALSVTATQNGANFDLDCLSTLVMSLDMARLVDTYKDHEKISQLSFTCHIRFSTDKAVVDETTMKLDSSIFELVRTEKSADGTGYNFYCRLKSDWKQTATGETLVQKLRKTMTFTADAVIPATDETLYASGWITVSNVPDPVLNSASFQVPMVTLATTLEGSTTVDSGVGSLLETNAHNAFMNGYTDGTFGPEKPIKRCEVAQIFYNLLINKNVTYTKSFTDVKEGAWYYNAVMTLASMGIINGRSADIFDPEAGITRAEFAAIASRFAVARTDGETFTDVPETHWAYKNITTASAYGWVNGVGGGKFEPDRGIKRCEAATIVNRMLGRSADPEALKNGQARTFTDVPASHWAYAQIAEATTAHSYTAGANGEIWG